MIDQTELVDAFSDSLGEQRAEQVIDDAASEAGIGRKRSYSREEALEIAERITDLDDASSFVRVSANTLATRIRAGDVGS